MFCANCGAQVPDGTKFCPSCGKPCSTGEMVSRLQDLLHLFYCHSLPAVFMLIIGTTNWEIV